METQKRLEHLRTERANLEKLSSDVLQKVVQGMANKGNYDVDMLSDMVVLMPNQCGRFSANG